MRSVLSFLLFLAATGFSYAQDYFYDENLIQVTSESATYYGELQRQGESSYIKVYRVSDHTLAFEGMCKYAAGILVRDGTIIKYYPNGKIESVGDFKDGSEVGLWKYYYEDGKAAGEERYDGNELLFVQRWDDSGKALLSAGNGVFQINVRGEPTHYEIVDYRLRSKFQIHNSDTVYIDQEKSAEYIGGKAALYHSLYLNLEYPPSAFKHGINDKVMVEFTIGEHGTVEEARILKGISHEYNEAALKAIKMLNRWTPALSNGKPVKEKIVLPIAFSVSRR